MGDLSELRKDRYDREFVEPMKELREKVYNSPWYMMDVNNNGVIIKVMGKGQTLRYGDGWHVQFCMYDQGEMVKKVISIWVKDFTWMEIPKDLRHGRTNVILDAFFNKDIDMAETAILPNGGVQFSQDDVNWDKYKEMLH